MRCPAKPLTLLAALLVILWTGALPARAQDTPPAAPDCDALLTAQIGSAARNDAARLQLGLRTMLGDESGLLRDGIIGSHTREALKSLCEMVPLPAGTDPVAGTVALALDYGSTAGADKDWITQARSAGTGSRLTAAATSGINITALRLAGPPPLVAATLAGADAGSGCTGFDPTSLTDAAGAGYEALTAGGPDGWSDPTTLCNALVPAPGSKDTAAAATAALTAYGTIETALPGAVGQLLSPGFSAWLKAEQKSRLPRLAGSDDAVIALLAEYRGTVPRDYSGLYATLPASCGDPVSRNVLEYSAFAQSDLDNLLKPVDVGKVLAGLDGKAFDSAEALMAAIREALAGQVTQCTLDQIAQAVFSPEDLGLRYELNAEETANLSLVKSFADSADAVKPLVGLTAPTRGALLLGVSDAIRKDATTAVEAEVALAADTLAAAAEELASAFDTRPGDVPEFPELPVTTLIGVTEATDSTVKATVLDEAFQKALLAASYAPAPNVEVLKGDVRRILAPIAAQKVEDRVTTAMVQIREVVERTWQLTTDLNGAILAAPAVGAAQSADLTEETAAALKTLVGVEYPNERLFSAAIDAVDPAPPDAIKAEARLAGFRRVENPAVPRDASALALPDCGCAARRRENGEIYAFFPFWLLPEAEAQTETGGASGDPAAGGDGASDGSDGEDAAAAALQQVDFGLISRIAFYGLEFAYGNPDAEPENRVIRLASQARWTEARRDFVDAAHRHRARADLAITLTGWADWSTAEIDDVVTKIVDLAAPFGRLKERDFAGLRAAFPTIFDKPQPDGVTLVFRGYSGVDGKDQSVLKLRTLVSQVAAALDDRGQTVNLALDLELAEVPASDGLMSDLRAILINEGELPTPANPGDGPADSTSRASLSPPPVENILVFLDRPTTDTKKLLRARMERGDYKGAERTEVLRRILPVVPPGGHRYVLQETRSSDASSAQTEEFSQFYDDVVYFQDNFAGIGFWPALDPTSDDMKVMGPTLANLMTLPGIPALLSPFAESIGDACTVICPNRAYLGSLAGLLAVVTALIIWRSFYSGLADKIAFGMGTAWIGTGAVAALLAALTLCDPAAMIAPVALSVLLLGMVLLIGFYAYQRARNGPKP